MDRIGLLDGMRGYFLAFMLLNHLTFTGGLWLVYVNHAELGFVQDAQGFVFLSGLLVGLVYTGPFLKGNPETARRRLLLRAAELYAYHVGLLLLIVALAQMLPFSWSYWGDWLGQLLDDTPAHLASAAVLAFQPTFMDILPQYILYLLVSPALIAATVAGRWLEILIGSMLLWLGVQLGAHLPVAAQVTAAVQQVVPDFAFRSGFNPLAWQIVFVSGLLLGALTAMRRIDWQRWLAPERTELLKVSLAVLAFFLLWRLAFTFGITSAEVYTVFVVFEDRGRFGLVFLLSFAAAAWVVAWLVVAGPRSPAPAARLVGGLLRRIFTAPFLVYIGKYSLQVYAFHVLLVYCVVAFDWWYGPFGAAAKTLLALAAIASLALPAWLQRRVRRLGRRLAAEALEPAPLRSARPPARRPGQR